MFTVSPLMRSEIPRAAAILAREFAGEPLQAYLLRDVPEARRARLLEPFFRTSLRLMPPRAAIATAREDGRLVGVRAGYRTDEVPTGRLWKLSGALRAQASLARLIASAPGYRAYLDVGRAMVPYLPTEPHWHFEWLAVEREYSGRGAAGMITRDGVALCEASGLGAWFATFTRLVAEYHLRYGWEIVGELTPLPGGPTCWVLWRPPPG